MRLLALLLALSAACSEDRAEPCSMASPSGSAFAPAPAAKPAHPAPVVSRAHS